MLLHELRLCNIGVFRGEQKIEFSNDPKQPITLIGGLNGCGKTTLLDSLQLVLYGNRARLMLRDAGTYAAHLRSLSSRGMASNDRSSISLAFSVASEGDTIHYRVTRGWSPSEKRVQERLDVIVNDERNSAVSDNWADLVEEILPLELSSLFFFDGEKIESLADPEQASSVLRTAVQALLGVSTLGRLRSDLLALQRRQLVEEDLSEGGEELQQLTSQADELQAEIDRLTQRKADIASENRVEHRRLDKLRAELTRRGGDLFHARQNIADRVTQVQEELRLVRGSILSQAEGSLPLSLVSKELLNSVDEAESDFESTQFQHVQSLLGARDERLLESLKDDEVRMTVSEFLLADMESMKTALSAPLDGEITLSDLSQLKQSASLMLESMPTLAASLGELERVQSELADAESQLAGVPDEDSITDALENVQSAEETVTKLTGRFEEVVSMLEQCQLAREKSLERMRILESDLLRHQVERDDVRRLIEHSERVRETLSKLEAALTEQNLGRIEAVTLDSLTRLMRKEALIKDLRIDTNSYELSLWTENDHEIAPSQLSAGERQLLATAILWALSKVAGSRVPTIIDTPLGRLDGTHRQLLVERYFPVAGRQVVLLSTDEEIDAALYDNLSRFVRHTYLLDHNTTAGTTEIVCGYWWSKGSPNAA